MENRSWTVTYRNRDNGQRITAAVFATDQRQAQEKARTAGQFSLLNLARSSRAGILPAPAAGRWRWMRRVSHATL